MIHSKILLAIQFISIFVILIPGQTSRLTDLWWILLLISTITTLWIFTHNKVGNFNIVPEIKENAKLIITGPYKFVRHPMYSSLILFMLGFVLWKFSFINIVMLCIMSITVFMKAYKEEKLWHRKDSAYLEYKKQTKMIIPFLL